MLEKFVPHAKKILWAERKTISRMEASAFPRAQLGTACWGAFLMNCLRAWPGAEGDVVPMLTRKG